MNLINKIMLFKYNQVLLKSLEKKSGAKNTNESNIIENVFFLVLEYPY